MDALNQRFGRDSVRIGSAALASNGAQVRSLVSEARNVRGADEEPTCAVSAIRRRGKRFP
jgi:hypothetical protein